MNAPLRPALTSPEIEARLDDAADWLMSLGPALAKIQAEDARVAAILCEQHVLDFERLITHGDACSQCCLEFLPHQLVRAGKWHLMCGPCNAAHEATIEPEASEGERLRAMAWGRRHFGMEG